MTDDATFSPFRTWPNMKMPPLSKEEWISVLILASNWMFVRVRELAVFALEKMATVTSFTKICLGMDHSIPSWVIDGFVGLVEATTITNFEAYRIDRYARYAAYRLFRIRELRITGKISSSRVVVEEIFKEDLNRLRSKEKMFSNKAAKIMGK